MREGDAPTQAELLAQARIAQALTACASAFAAASRGSEVEESLLRLCKAAELDVLGVSKLVEDANLGPCLFSELWVDPTWEGPNPPHLGLVPLSEVPTALRRLSAGEVHRFRSRSDLPERDRALVSRSPAQLHSLVEVPVFVSGEWSGGVLFGSRTEGRTWSEDEERLLQSLADLISSTWTRDQALAEAHDAIEARDRNLRLAGALIASATTLLGDPVEDGLPRAIRAVLRAIGGDVAYIDRNVVDHPNEPAFQTIHVIRSHGPEEEFDDEIIAWSNLPEMYSVLSSGKPHAFSNREELSKSTRTTLASFTTAVQAGIDHPIMVDGEFVGVVGIGDLSPREWTRVEYEMMEAVAAMIGAHWTAVRAHARLEMLLDAKDEFLASVSHELRTPLAVVVGMSEVLREEGPQLSEEERAEFTLLLAEQSAELSNLVEDLLVVARAEEAPLKVLPEEIDVCGLIADVIRALPSHLSSSVETRCDPGVAKADPLRVRQIIRNLIGNAHRHGGPSIAVAARQVDDRIEIAVSDDGPGIAAGLRSAVFEPYTSSPGDSGTTGSIGLGLTVSRRLARVMGGDVTLEPSDTGAKFVLTLPVT